ncbi:DUF1707 domain-containing protein [Mycobacterium sp. E796]|uniref:DUF1707 SHOCT-like domain-containing protein n=1 Tax=Mycobacterium sp. E796 TaxID=1834151 RepID=UPI0007FC5654|nr:DUF1707 domain-containing protein [Mycobacterium sp. E796]OBI47985.1 hypothetical protein A5706_27980 [Mycobacterium sp. E796]
MSAGYIRATDSDRDETGRVLDAALSDGQLSMEEYRQRVSAASRAATVGELESLVEDLQVHNAQPPTPSSRRGILVAGVAVLALAGLGIGWKMLGNSASRPQPASLPSATSIVAITPTTPSPPPPLQLQTTDGLSGLLAQMRKEIGDTMGYRLVVYQDHADLDRPDPQDPRNSVTYHYAGRGWSQWGASAIPSTSTAGDLSKFNVQEVASVLRGAPQILQVAGANNTYLMVESARDGSLALSIYVFRDRDGGHMELNADGTVRAIEPARR